MKKRVQISINPNLLDAARDLMEKRFCDSFSELLEVLIREDLDRREKEAGRGAYPPNTPRAIDLNEVPIKKKK